MMELSYSSRLLAEPSQSGVEGFEVLGIKDKEIVFGSPAYKAINQAIIFGLEILELKKMLAPSSEVAIHSLKGFEPVDVRARAMWSSFDQPKDYRVKLKSVYCWMVEGESDSRLLFLKEKMKSVDSSYCPNLRPRRINL